MKNIKQIYKDFQNKEFSEVGIGKNTIHFIFKNKDGSYEGISVKEEHIITMDYKETDVLDAKDGSK